MEVIIIELRKLLLMISVQETARSRETSNGGGAETQEEDEREEG